MALYNLAPILATVALLLLLAACGLSRRDVERLADERVATALAAVPTVTPQPTTTLMPAPTAVPTATPVTFPDTPTPITLLNTATPQPTATPIPIPPTATPQPTATPIRIPPTATLQTALGLPPVVTQQPTVDFNKVYLGAWPSVFLIEGVHGNGSGWLIERGLILTNQHVVEGTAGAVVLQAAAPPFPANVIAVDTILDIALLQFDPDTAPLSSFATPLPTGQIGPGDTASPLMALGYSGTAVKSDETVGSASVNIGVLSQVFNTDHGLELVIDAPVDPGDSGGPVLNANGEVVGMVRAAQQITAGGQRVVGTFLAIHIDEIRNALPSLKSGISR